MVNYIMEITNIAKNYNSAIAAVDIAVINYDLQLVLLGRKPKAKKFRFPGGFVDVKDKSYEETAHRELQEECPNIEADDFRYIGSLQIDDPRYRNDKDKIFSCLFTAQYIYGNLQAGDDLEELSWFNFSQLEDEKNIVPEHNGLRKILLKDLKCKN